MNIQWYCVASIVGWYFLAGLVIRGLRQWFTVWSNEDCMLYWLLSPIIIFLGPFAAALYLSMWILTLGFFQPWSGHSE